MVNVRGLVVLLHVAGAKKPDIHLTSAKPSPPERIEPEPQAQKKGCTRGCTFGLNQFDLDLKKRLANVLQELSD
jgi:hypothetical protein